MNKNKELAKNTLILTVGKICTQFVSFIMLPLYTALLAPEEFGIVDLFHTYITLLVPLFNWQFENGLFRFLIDDRSDENKVKKLFSTVISTNFVQIGIYLCFYAVAQRFINSEFKIFLAIDVALNILQCTLLQFPRGMGNNTRYAFSSFLSASTAVILNVVFIAGFKMGAYGMFIATVIAKIVSIVHLSLSQKVWRYFSFEAMNKRDFMELCKYSLPLVPNSFSWWVVGVSDRSVVSGFLGVAANGIYSVANKFPSVFIIFFNIFNMSWTESVSLHINDEDSQSFMADTINSMFKLFSALALGLVACMPFVFPLMVNSKYDEAYLQIPILMLAILFQIVVGLYSVVYIARKKSGEIAKTSFYSAVVNLVVDIVLIQFVGLYAASLSTLAAYMVMAFYRYFHVKKYINIPLSKKSLISTIGMTAVIFPAYYLRNTIVCAIVLLLTTIYAFLINKEFLSGVVKIVKTKLKK